MQPQPSSGFSGLGIAPNLLNSLHKHKYVHPTPIQERSIPTALEGKDLVGIAQTGTGKTLAFGIPMIQRSLQGGGHGLIVLPTRELAIQVRESLQKIGGEFGIKTALLIGGTAMGRQIAEIQRGPDIVIGTPGRIIDHLDHRTLSFSKVAVLVLDEADRMLDMGFAPQLKRILQHVPAQRQTMLFSATMPPAIMQIASSYMQLPVRIEVVPQGTAATNVTQEVFVVPRNQKSALLHKILSEYHGSILVFTRMKFSAKRITRVVRAAGYTAAELHSNRSLNQRTDALEGFKNGRYRVLIATDIAARGIDVTNIELVINYDLPQQAEDYVHRIGRTGRAGASGHAISFATPDQRGDLRTIERLLRKSLPISKLPESLPEPPEPAMERPSGHGASQRFDRNRRPHHGFGNRNRQGGNPRFRRH